MDTLGIIPARAGSKGVPNKNIRPLAGRPLVEYTVRAAQHSRLDRVILSTDSPEIAEIGREQGAETPFLRPAELAQDSSSAISVVRHALDFLRAEEGWTPYIAFYLQPTSPFRTSRHIDESLASLVESDFDSVVSLSPVDEHPAFMFFLNASGTPADVLDPVQFRRERRQDLRPTYSLDCNILGSRTDFLERQDARDGAIVNLENFCPYIIDFPASLDINIERDFLFADTIMQRQTDE